MSDLVVVDASVALKWLVHEPGSDEAGALLTELANGTVSLVAPEHLVGEVVNGLRTRVAQGVLDVELVSADMRLVESAAARSLPVRALSVS